VLLVLDLLRFHHRDHLLAPAQHTRSPGHLVSWAKISPQTVQVAEVHEQVAALLGGPCAVRVGCHTQDVHAPGRYLHHEQHVQAPEEDLSTWKKSRATKPSA